MNPFAQKIEEKQKQYYALESEIAELIGSFVGMDISYKGNRGIVLEVYTDSTADVLLCDENDKEWKENVSLNELGWYPL